MSAEDTFWLYLIGCVAIMAIWYGTLADKNDGYKNDPRWWRDNDEAD